MRSYRSSVPEANPRKAGGSVRATADPVPWTRGSIPQRRLDESMERVALRACARQRSVRLHFQSGCMASDAASADASAIGDTGPGVESRAHLGAGCLREDADFQMALALCTSQPADASSCTVTWVPASRALPALFVQDDFNGYLLTVLASGNLTASAVDPTMALQLLSHMEAIAALATQANAASALTSSITCR